MRTIAATLVATLLLAAAAQAGPPAELAPKQILGSGWNVMDLEAMRTWYQDKLGMKLMNTMSRNGQPFEYLMGFEGQPQGSAILALLKSPTRQPGPNAMGRLILGVPDAKGLADNLGKQGVPVREVIPNSAYFITDPEGNAVELYTPR